MSSAARVPYVDAFMQAALAEAALALDEGEVPVGCVFVRQSANAAAAAHGKTSTAAPAEAPRSEDAAWIAARGRNQTNVLHHALAHAEFVAAQKLVESKHAACTPVAASSSSASPASPPPVADLSDYVLYVTVEPCVMCGAMLLYNRVAHVFFGCRNPRFGGNGTVLALHEPPPPSTSPRGDVDSVGGGTDDGQRCGLTGACDGGVEEWWPGYASEGGHGEAEAIALLQCFYERENPNAPDHKRRRKA